MEDTTTTFRPIDKADVSATPRRPLNSTMDRSVSPRLYPSSTPDRTSTAVSEHKGTPFSGRHQPHTYKSVDRGANPSPCEYEKPSGFGSQSDSKKPSRPSFGFSKTEKLPSPRSFNVSFHLTHGSPGKYPESTKKNLPAYSFGSQKRPEKANNVENITAHVDFLGPDASSGAKVYVESSKRSSPRYSFGKSPRGDVSPRKDNAPFLNPEAVVLSRSLVSTKKSAPAYGFGSAPRENTVIPASSRTGLSSTVKSTTLAQLTADSTVLSPRQTTSIGKMVESHRPSLPAYGFGTTERLGLTKSQLLTAKADYLGHTVNSIGSPSPNKHHAPSHTFGTTTREAARKPGMFTS